MLKIIRTCVPFYVLKTQFATEWNARYENSTLLQLRIQ